MIQTFGFVSNNTWDIVFFSTRFVLHFLLGHSVLVGHDMSHWVALTLIFDFHCD